MKIHKEGSVILIVLFLFLTGINILVLLFTSHLYFYLLLPVSLVFFVLISLFFRSPYRKLPAFSDGIFSPADGKVIIIEKVFEKEYFQREMLKVSIFMSVWNVHLNRFPVSGRVVYQAYHPGRFFVAFLPKSSELNERNTIVIEDAKSRQILVRQIAGTVARRIRCYSKLNNDFTVGDELGFIRFGSRVDLFLPLDINLKVNLDQKVFGKKTIIAEY